nr:MAG TPA: tail tape measure [Caudoviricetes sp.]
MAKTIGVLLSLKDQFTTPLQKATKSVKNMDRQLEKAGNQIKAFGNRVKAGMKTVAKWGAIGFGALTAAAGVFIKQSIDAAKDKLKADKLLETNLMKQANFKKEHIQMLKDEASALQDVGVVGDDVAVAGAGQLAIYKLKAEQIKTILPVIDDMVAKEKGFNGTQEDAIAMADVFGKAVEGKTKGLVKYGVSLTDAEEKLFKTMKREQRAEFLNKKLTAAIGGTNKALRETDEGKIVAAKGAWGDMQAELGKKLMPKLGAIAEWFHSKIPAIQNFILGIADKIQELVTKAEPYIEQLKDIFGRIFEKVKPAMIKTWNILSNLAKKSIDIAQKIITNWDRISPIVYTLVGAITAYNIATTIRNNKELIYAGIIKSKMALDTAQALLTGQLTIKQWALNVAMNANPIGLIITAIAVLIGVGWMLYKNWDLIKKKVSELWDKLLNWLQPAIDTVKAAFEKIIETINKVKEAFQKVKEKISGAIDKLKFWNKTEAKDKEINITENTKKTTETIGGANKTGVTPTTVKNPRHALGTAYFKGGVTGINEGERDETAILPAGTKILSHEEGKTIQKNNTNKKIEVIINIDGNFIGEKEHMEKYGEYTANKILAALNNM